MGHMEVYVFRFVLTVSIVLHRRRKHSYLLLTCRIAGNWLLTVR